MKKMTCIAILILLMSFKSTKNDFISIEYTGNSDYELPVVYLSKKTILFSEMSVKIEAESGLPHDYIIYNNEFQYIKRLLYLTDDSKIDHTQSNGFMITLQENLKKKDFFVMRKNANSFFLKINAFLSNHESRNKELIETMDGLRTTNVFK